MRMKHLNATNRKNNILPARSSPRATIQISFEAPAAHEVFVAGDFNGWNLRSTPLRKDAQGIWRAQIQVSPGPHEYRLIVDGQWQNDPHAAASVANPFGSSNSFVQAAA
jgi:1,4-alpha-glucan branching enzyme